MLNHLKVIHFKEYFKMFLNGIIKNMLINYQKQLLILEIKQLMQHLIYINLFKLVKNYFLHQQNHIIYIILEILVKYFKVFLKQVINHLKMTMILLNYGLMNVKEYFKIVL